MKVYLAAAWARRLEILEVAKQLEAVGIEVTSRWLVEEVGIPTGNQERANIDLEDLDRADALVRFTDYATQHDAVIAVPKSLLTAARMVEMGYALAKGKRVFVVGGHQNVFDHLAQVEHIKDVPELVKTLEENVTVRQAGA